MRAFLRRFRRVAIAVASYVYEWVFLLLFLFACVFVVAGLWRACS